KPLTLMIREHIIYTLVTKVESLEQLLPSSLGPAHAKVKSELDRQALILILSLLVHCHFGKNDLRNLILLSRKQNDLAKRLYALLIHIDFSSKLLKEKQANETHGKLAILRLK